MISARELTKRHGDVLAVDGLSFDVGPGIVTGFLGANGSGKSTTLRMVLGLDRPTSGTVTVDGAALRGAGVPGRVAHHHVAPGLLRPALEPVDAARVDLDGAEADACGFIDVCGSYLVAVLHDARRGSARAGARWSP